VNGAALWLRYVERMLAHSEMNSRGRKCLNSRMTMSGRQKLQKNWNHALRRH
jgi:hypothetical protein